MPADTLLHRIHDRSREPTSFNPCQGRPTRFAPLWRIDGSCIATAYAAQSLECAVHETIFHEIGHSAAIKVIDTDAIESLDHSTIALSRDLILCGLFEPDLNRWRLTRRDLIDTFPTSYATTASWAIAAHDMHPDIDGLIWTSRRCDPMLACVLFGDRLGNGSLHTRSRDPIDQSPALLSQMRDFAGRAGITLVF